MTNERVRRVIILTIHFPSSARDAEKGFGYNSLLFILNHLLMQRFKQSQ